MSDGALNRKTWVWLLATVLMATGCGGDDSGGEGETDSPTATADEQGTGDRDATSRGGDSTAADDEPTGESDFRIAAAFSGSTTDADYNTLGLLALEAAEDDLGAEIAFSESVPVPDIERVMREYLSQDYNVIWTHGGQFYEQTANLAASNPEVFFIAESDVLPEDTPDNLWVIDREFQVGFYALGALGAMMSDTGRIGYIGGLSLPFSYAEVHAMRQAIDEQGLDAEVVPVWTGDFNEPSAARQTASQMLSQDIDVIVGSLNLGMVGVFGAVNEADNDAVRVTAKYTDKSQFSEDRYVTSVLYDFAGPLKDILSRIESGETSGYYPLGFDTGVSLQAPKNVDEQVAAEIDELVKQVEAGEIEVVENFDPIE